MRCIVLAVVLSMVAVTAVYGDMCDLYANGCSIPFGLSFTYKTLFTPSCNRHDICYGCVSLIM